MAIRLSELAKMPEGARSRVLGDLVEKSKGKPNGQMKEIDASIRELEMRYEMSSAEMRAGFKAGTVRDTADISRWLMLLRVRDRAIG